MTDAWQALESLSQIEAIVQASTGKPQLIFKHSTRCGISYQIKQRLIQASEKLGAEIQLHYLDLIAFRSISNSVAERLGVMHQSPQVILVHQGEVAYHASHYNIEPDHILTSALAL